jgi:N-acetylglucosamine-6-sulfatase
MTHTAPSILVLTASFCLSCNTKPPLSGKRENQPSIIFILVDDHRFDAMGFMGHSYLETPNLDRMAREGLHFSHAMVTTSLCSPSRASILTGLYTHNHRVADNYNPVNPELIFFPEYLQEAGYSTAFIGKWHMGGESDDPQRGFDYWLSFKGQGTYWADGRGTSRVVPQTTSDGFNLNGKRVPQKGYITDELSDYALKWLETQTAENPFFLYLSHKAVHSDFVAADRHTGRYKGKAYPLPATAQLIENKPMWLINQRNSRHGAEFGYNLPDFDLTTYHQRYCETLLSVDENLGRIMEWVEESDFSDNTLVVYMGDNGFHFGEQGLIDKRTAYEASIRVPLLIWWPGKIKHAGKIDALVANIDLAPTFIDLAGLPVPETMDGESFKPLIEGRETPWREEILYEYYWERNYPYTPTMHALISSRYKFIRYHGIWDLNEFYDLETDPEEKVNLIDSEHHQKLIEEYRTKLFEILDSSPGGSSMPLLPDRGETYPMRNPVKAGQAGFPERFYFKGR